uniref:Tenascin-R n=1 Tax=Ciona intestinalis TaxID=7719 RepID=F6U9T7_CIOIN
CNGHGRCNEDTGQCRCHGSWEGPECSAQRCLRDCSGNGDCLNGRCQCDEPWTGKACRILKCPNQCSSNGKCRNGTCVCRNEWTGDDCSSPKCPDDCSGNLKCIDGRCRCWGGWEGNSCSHVIKPSGLEISNIQPTTIDVSWIISPPYLISYWLPLFVHVTNLLFPVQSNKTSVLIKDLSPGETYSVALYAVQGENVSTPININFTTSLDAPKSVEFIDVTSTSATAWWVPSVAKITGYKFALVQFDGQNIVEDQVTSTSRMFTFTNLKPRTRYNFTIHSIRGEEHSVPLHANLITGIDAPTNLRIASTTPTSVSVTWSKPHADVEGYSVECLDVRRGARQEIKLSGDEWSATFTSLRPATEYNITIQAELDDISSTKVWRLTYTTLPQPQNIRVSSPTFDDLVVIWDPVIVFQQNDTSYVINVTSVIARSFRFLPCFTDKTSTVLQGLTPGTEYLINVFTVYNERVSIPVQLSVTTAIDPPTRLMFVTVSDSSFTIHWQQPIAMVANYIVTYYRSSSTGESQTMDQVVKGDETSAVITGLLADTQYAVTVHANVGDLVAKKRQIKATTASSLESPETLRITNIRDTSAHVRWDPVIDKTVTGYLLRYKPVGGSTEDEVKVGLKTFINLLYLPGLLPGRSYTINIRSFRWGVDSADATSITITTLHPLLPPRDLILDGRNQTEARIRWTPTTPDADAHHITLSSLRGGGSPFSVRLSPTSGMANFKDLKPGTRYRVTLVTMRGNQSSDSRVLKFRTDERLDSPSNITVSLMGENGANITWKISQQKYDRIYFSYSSDDETGTVTISGRSTRLPLEYLQAGTSYNVSVTALGRNKESLPLVGKVTTLLNPPSKLNATSTTSASVQLTWEPPLSPVDGFVIKYHELVSRKISRRPSVIVKSLVAGTKYVFQVVARKDGREAYSMRVVQQTAKVPYPKPKDCVQVLRNGETLNKVYEIYPYNGITLKVCIVFCDLHTDGGGWLTFQRRQDGSLSFHRSWDEYMSGFGNLTKEFWIGLQTLHELTMTNDQTLRIDMRYKDEVSYAVYRNFSLSDAATGFMLHASGYTGTAGDSLSYHDGMKFTTYDRDNDDATNRNCAKEYKGAWWFKNCHRSSLNGLYGNSRHSQGVNWYSWGGFTRSIEFVEMKLRPQSFIQPTVKPAIMRRFEAIVSTF